MRREHSEVTDHNEIERILHSTTIGRLATNGADGYPYVTPVSFVFHEGCIYFHCATSGEKLANIQRDPRVCFEVDVPLAYFEAAFDPERRACKLHQFYHCVIIRGEASIIPAGPPKTSVLNTLVMKHEGAGTELQVTGGFPSLRCLLRRPCATVIDYREERPRSEQGRRRAAHAGTRFERAERAGRPADDPRHGIRSGQAVAGQGNVCSADRPSGGIDYSLTIICAGSVQPPR